MMFETKSDAEQFIQDKGKEWVGVDGGYDEMTICELID